MKIIIFFLTIFAFQFFLALAGITFMDVLFLPITMIFSAVLGVAFSLWGES